MAKERQCIGVVAGAICLSIVGIPAGTAAVPAARQPTNTAARELVPVPQTLARERDVQIVYRTELVGAHRTRGASGNLTFEEALT